MAEPTRFACAGGPRLAVYEQGRRTGPTVLLMHGYPDNASVFDALATALGARFRVLRYDVRGMGRSQAPADGDYTLRALTADLAAVLADETAPVHLVGHDWGSIQGWQAVTEPSLAERFASFTTISGPYPAHLAAWWRGAGLAGLSQLLRSSYVAAFQLPVLPELVMGSAPMRALFGARLRDAVQGLALYRANLFTGGHERRCTSVPVQQLELTRDPFVTSASLRAAEPWCTRLYRRRLDAGHWAPRDQPRAVARLVTEFIDYLDGSARPIDLARVA